MRLRNALVLVVALLAIPVLAAGQELDPRAYSASPVGTSFVLTGFSNTSGDVVFDASSVINDVHANVNSATVSTGRTFDFLGRQASVAIGLPYAWGQISGSVGEQRQSITRSGLGDPRLRLGIMLWGGEAMDAKTFVSRPRNPILGASLVVVAPLGQYMPDKLINIGTNRWAFKPELGFSYPAGHWQFDAYAGIWLFADNTDFYGGHRKSQDAIASFQGHVSYTIRPGLWVAVDATQYSGGVSSVDGVANSTRQDNLRLGVTVSLPVKVVRGLTVKLTYSDGAVVRVGSDFSSVGMTFQYAWLAD
jgi:hypothetical protein